MSGPQAKTATEGLIAKPVTPRKWHSKEGFIEPTFVIKTMTAKTSDIFTENNNSLSSRDPRSSLNNLVKSHSSHYFELETNNSTTPESELPIDLEASHLKNVGKATHLNDEVIEGDELNSNYSSNISEENNEFDVFTETIISFYDYGDDMVSNVTHVELDRMP